MRQGIQRKAKATNMWTGIDLRKLKKELKLIPFDIKREMRFLDLLFSERNIVRTQAEHEVLRDMIDHARSCVEFHQDRLVRFQQFYDRVRKKKPIDQNMLFPVEMQSLLKWSVTDEVEQPHMEPDKLRTGTDG